jgi:hypothetical protein
MDRHDRRHAYALLGSLAPLINQVPSMIGCGRAFHDRSTSQQAGSIPPIGTSALPYPPVQPKSYKLHKFDPVAALLLFALSFNQVALIYVQWRTLWSLTSGPPCYTSLSPYTTTTLHHQSHPRLLYPIPPSQCLGHL